MANQWSRVVRNLNPLPPVGALLSPIIGFQTELQEPQGFFGDISRPWNRGQQLPEARARQGSWPLCLSAGPLWWVGFHVNTAVLFVYVWLLLCCTIRTEESVQRPNGPWSLKHLHPGPLRNNVPTRALGHASEYNATEHMVYSDMFVSSLWALWGQRYPSFTHFYLRHSVRFQEHSRGLNKYCLHLEWTILKNI